MRDLRPNESILTIGEPTCLTCDDVTLTPPEAGAAEWRCPACGAAHHAVGAGVAWHIRPVAAAHKRASRRRSGGVVRP